MVKTKQKKSFKEYLKSLGKYFVERSKSNIAMTVLMALYVAFCIGSIIYFAIIAHGRDCLIGLTYFVIFPIFYLAEYNLKIRSPLPYTIFVLVFCVFCYLGASYNFYTIIPMLDDILHACWGLLFTSLGFCIIKSLMGEPKTVKAFVAYLLFGIGFCMILSIVWEIYEYSFDSLFPSYDMQEDTVVNHIHSFMLHEPYDHLNTYQIDGIYHTDIFGYDNNGNPITLTIDGYLDIGLHDTMMDIIWCVISTTVLCVVLAIDRKLGGKLNPHIIPVYVGSENGEENAEEESLQEPAAAQAEAEEAENAENADKVE